MLVATVVSAVDMSAHSCIFLFTSATATVSGNVIVNTVAGVPPGQFQANKRLASPVIPGALSVSPDHPHTAHI